MANNRTLLVIGSGPGIGTNTAALFAQKGFTKIGLISRNAARLASDAETVGARASSTSQAGVEVKTFTADTGDVEGLRSALAESRKLLGSPQVVLYNSARIAPTAIGATEPQVLLDDFAMMNVGLYVAATWALPLLLEQVGGRDHARPTFLLSGGYVHEDPVPEVFSLCMQKAAQHNLMKSLDKKFGPQGVHFAVVNIGGEVKDEDPVINVTNISQVLWELSQEERGQWRHSVDVGVERSP